jgi:hypothetical protein
MTQHVYRRIKLENVLVEQGNLAEALNSSATVSPLMTGW